MLHFFLFGPDIAAVQDSDQAAKHADAGWKEVKRGPFMEGWKARDRADWARLWEGKEKVDAPGASPPGPAVERAVGWQAPWILVEMPKKRK